ncbi:hydrolase 1, exosortase A system-associated [Thauera sp. SDU_THAU2]|uniref:hydrolase 1, exosortase A system-associated n=1 Tax=Thauera sp. SDU_THAU2 TaxID=3136633 RepID=UPI00311DD3D3
MEVIEQALMFDCGDDSLLGVVSTSDQNSSAGVLIVVGGPQYRVGSHRQFVNLARYLARNGVPCMRFDYRGMGDATGAQRSFAEVGDDMLAAIEAFAAATPGLKRIVLWGLCDGASAACMAMPAHPLIAGAVLLNPWVRTEAGNASVMLRHYYLKRFFDGRFWRKLLRGDVHFLSSLRSLLATVAGSGKQQEAAASATQMAPKQAPAPAKPPHLADVPGLPQRMLKGLAESGQPFAILLSGRDFVAREFQQLAAADLGWRRLMASRQAVVRHFEQADHTFSRMEDAREVERFTLEWINLQISSGFRS